MSAPPTRLIAVLLPLALAACGDGNARQPAPTLDDELAVVEGQDPLLAAVVQDPIMSDPQLSTRSNVDAIRPPAEPYAAPIPATEIAPPPTGDDGTLTSAPAPAKGACRQCAVARDALTLGALAARQDDPSTRRCAASLRYAAGWANRLPADLPLYGAARVIEAGGTDAAGCAVRAVTFASPRPVDHMLDWYFTQAAKAGYASDHQADGGEHVLAGTRPDGARYVAFVRAAPGGSEIDLVVSGTN